MNFRIGCVQFRSQLGDMDYNLAQLAHWCEQARAQGARVVVFPEACLTGYCRPREMAMLAQPFAGSLRERAAEIARAHEILLVFGMPEREGGNVYNSLIALDAKGNELGRYRKTHLWAAESKWATPGDQFVTFKTEYAHFGLMLCYDTRFPEVSRALALRGIEVALVASAWRSTHVEEWRFCARARALDNGIFLAGSDAILEAEHFTCAGGSLIVGPDGRVMALANYGEEGMITAEIDTERIAERRKDLPLLQQRRPELYGSLAASGSLALPDS